MKNPNKSNMLLVVLIAFFCYSCKINTTSQAKETPTTLSLKLSQDSGYIYADEAFKLLLSNKLIDTSNITNEEGHIQYAYSLGQPISSNTTRYYKFWEYEPTDTIGKYYAIDSTENYLAAISLGEDIMLLELNTYNELVGYDTHGYNPYGHNGYPCCRNSADDLLKKYNGYFTITTCGTGDSYCSEYITILKGINSLSDLPIPVSKYSESWGNDAPGLILSSTMELKADSLTMHYTLEEFIENDNKERENILTRYFTVSYTLKNNRFETEEGYKFDGIPI